MTAKKRRPLLALVLSLIQPGLGQVYNGQLLKGITVFGIGFALVFFISVTGMFYIFKPMVTAVIVMLCFFLYILGDAFFGARRIGEIELKPYNKWYIYLIIILISSFLIQPFQTRMLKAKSYKIPSDAMAPTLISGDHITVNLKAYQYKKPQRSDVIVFIYPEDESKDFIKRVVGVEGDIIEIREKQLYVNGILESKPYAVHKDNAIIPAHVSKRDYYGPQQVPKDMFFVLGDNRDRSADSRFWGFVGNEHIRGKAVYIYWSNGLSRIGNII